MSEEFIPVGKISGIFGVKGWMKVFSFTEPRQNILGYSPLYISRKGEWVEAKISGGRAQGKGIVIGLVDITDPDQVLPLIGSELAITKKQLKPTAKDEFYWSDLIGLEVINLRNEVLGQVKEVLATGAHDVLLVQDKEHDVERLIPFVMGEIVEQVSLDDNVIQVNWELDY